MPKLDTILYRVRNPGAQIRFYCDVLGMTYHRERDCVSYHDREAGLRFFPCHKPYVHAKRDLYWKITIAVPDIELAHSQLLRHGINVSDPHQFQDVGYVAHFCDPEAFVIELIDHKFAGRPRPVDVNTKSPGGGAHLNLLTLRTADIVPVRHELTARGMKLIGLQPVDDFGFTLYFFAYTDESPPAPKLESVENREWLYQRPYTVIEVQHLHSTEEITHKQAGDAGYFGAVIAGCTENRDYEALGLTAKPG